jgi:hypothetical protein
MGYLKKYQRTTTIIYSLSAVLVASGIAHLLVANSKYSDYKDLSSVGMKANEIAEKQLKYRSLLLRPLYTLDYAHGS